MTTGLIKSRLLAAVILLAAACAAVGEGQVPIRLKTEMLTNPLGLNTPTPRLSWVVQDSRTGAGQSAWQVQASSSREDLLRGKPDLWDSGRVSSARSHLVEYAGKMLSSRKQVWWRVKSWDELGVSGGWSEPAWFEVGLLISNDWNAKWIAAPKCSPAETDATRLWSRMCIVPMDRNIDQSLLAAFDKKQLEEKWGQALDKIRPAPLFRKTFSLDGAVRSARLYLCGLGFHELTVNGARVDDTMMPPAESHYSEYAHYVVRDVTTALRAGDNELEILLGDGRYDEELTYSETAYGEDLPLLFQLEVVTDRGTVTIISDDSCQVVSSPLLKSHFWLSEVYDARREISGWSAAQVIPAPTKKLIAQTIPPERIVRRIRPVAVTNPHDGVWVFDMGELIVGCAELSVRVPEGTMLAMRYGEQLFTKRAGNYIPSYDGSILHYDDFENTVPMPGMLSSKRRGNGFHAIASAGKKKIKYHCATSCDVYVANGDPAGENWHARFAYHPFRYVELTGYPGVPSADVLTGLVVHTDLKETGSFESSDPALNLFYEAAQNSADYTTHGSVNDNTGTEKQNGLTPAISSGKGAVFFRDVGPLWQKLLVDLRAVTPESMIPKMLGSGLRAPPELASRSTVWSRHGVEIPWYLYLHFGDRDAMGTYYPYMKAYVDYFCRDVDSKGTLPADAFGDHMDFCSAYNQGPAVSNGGDGAPRRNNPDVRFLTDRRLVGAAYAIGMTREVSKAADILGHSDDAARYAGLADRMTHRFNELWFVPGKNSYGRRPPHSQFTVQGGNSLALYFDLVPAERRQAVLDAFVQDVRRWGGVSTGMAATCPLIMVLARNGYADMALKVLTQPEYPGPGHSLTFGTRTLPETWARPDAPPVTSFVQSEYVWLARWLFTELGGINPDPDQPGFKHFYLKPVVPEQLGSVCCKTETPYGEIISDWNQENGGLIWNITIPWNTTATVQLPQSFRGRAEINGKVLGKPEAELQSGTWTIILSKQEERQ